MQISNCAVVVTGGASGLGRATAEHLAQRGARVVIADLPASAGESVAQQIGHGTSFVPADVTSEPDMLAVFAAASSRGLLRAVVHCAGRGGPLRILDKNGAPGAQAAFEAVVKVNLFGTFNVLRLAAAAMAPLDEVAGERGAIVLTASIAAYEGQIGQIPYASAKAGIVGMTLVAARDLASRKIRVCTIAPGVFDTAILARVPADVRDALARSVPHPARLGDPREFALLAGHILENSALNGETIRLDGALRMSPR
ncbi:MAG: SDR family NAD(P)-dependent oxidoreductase [Steroidobacteraceae bacterium]|nr:SDR family NAD(P)-dependent oxidoreductase [Nevskiaceae bacterium]MCP5359788.1 SDR family NAD(P)-dependent oxidoreductase [Nevskiaceae bacterium]MCP5467415.1 SDR family NAD(P)-dependent oxidoreductase [Nevskiaceae bacterium]MCP5472722.1 SDR family NAD(P)-dependent oxidoreductase [Nevskiaceae bacterium]